MKKSILAAVVCALIFSGCTPKQEGQPRQLDPEKVSKAYEVGKVIYKVGKVAVKASGVEVGSDLVIADKVLIGVDKARTEVKKNVPTQSYINQN